MRRLHILVLLVFFPAFGQALAAPLALGKVEAADSACRIEWSAAPQATGYNIYIKVDGGGFRKLNTKPLSDTFARLTDLVNGAPYFFAVTAIGANGEESAASVAPMVVPRGYGYKTLSFKGSRSAKDYATFSTPYLRESNDPKDFLSYLPPYSQDKWRIFSMDKDGYHEYESIKNIEPGKAYWFLSAKDTDLFLAGKTADNNAPFSVRLQPGWNLIGSPFLYPVEWKEVLSRNGATAQDVGSAMWEYGGGGFHKMGTLLPYHGYLVHNASGENIDLLIPPTPAAPKVYQENTEYKPAGTTGGGATGWLMKIAANDGTYRDDDNYIGVETENAHYEGMDAHKPPAWPQHLSLYFQRQGENGAKRSADIRHSSKKWTAVVEGGQNSIVTISWKTIAGTPKTTMTDLTDNRKVDMTKTGAYSFKREGGAPRRFIIREHR